MGEQIALVAKTCPVCGKEEQHPIPQDGYMKFKAGMLVQRALPELNDCIREFLITGMCTDCREETDRATLAMENDYEEECGTCAGEGYVLDDCFEDTCCCADPETQHGHSKCPDCERGK